MFAWQRPVGHTDPGDPAWFPTDPAKMYDADADPPVTYGRTGSHVIGDAYRVVEFELGGLFKVSEVDVFAKTYKDSGPEVAALGRCYIWDGAAWVESDIGEAEWFDWMADPFSFAALPETTKIKLEIKTNIDDLSKVQVFDVKCNVEVVPRKGGSQIAII